MRDPEPGRLARAFAAALPFALAAVAVAASDGENRAWVVLMLASGVAYQAWVVVRRRRHRMFGVEAAAGVLLAGLLVAALTGPRTGVLLLMPAGLAYLFVGLALLQHESVRDRVRRALPRRRAPPDDAATAARRDVSSLALVLPTCALALLLVPLATWTPRAGAGAGAGAGTAPGGAGDTQAPDRHEDAPAPGPEPDVHGVSGLAPPPPDTPDRSLQRPAHVEVRPWIGGLRAGNLGALYLRGIPLVETGSDRWREDLAGLRWTADADDGDADEWCGVGARPAETDAMELEVIHAAPDVASTGEAVLFGPPSASAFEVPQVRAKPGGPYLVGRPSANGPFEYRVEATLPWRVARPGSRVVQHPLPKVAAADDEGTASGVLADAARRAVAGVEGDVERVRAVMRVLHGRFAYEELQDRSEGATTLAAFVTARRGTCIQFAKAGVVMLRHVGIAARVGTGFLLTDWDEQRGAYVADGRDRHAWVEVEVEGSGWVIFDPTPAAPAEVSPQADPAARGAGAEPSPQDEKPAEEKPEEPPPAAKRDPGSVRGAIDDVRRALAAAWDRVTGNWPLFAAAALVAAALAAQTMFARKRRLAGEQPAGPVARGPWEDLISELARRGHRRRPSQTASEFARSVLGSGGDAYAPFVSLTLRHEAARFGARDLTPADDAALEAFRRALPPR